MPTEHFDYAVVGFSLAGIAGSLTFARAGKRVILFDFHRDTDALANLPYIQRTSLGRAASGLAFDRAMGQLLDCAGVTIERNAIIQSIAHRDEVIIESQERRWLSKGVVFSPNGTEPGIHIQGTSALQGFGISYSAADDAPFYRSRPVAVYGDMPRVLEHARMAVRDASEVTVLLTSDRPGDLLSPPNIRFESSVVLHAVQAGADGLLHAVEFSTPNHHNVLDVSALFVAQHPVPAVDVIVGPPHAAIISAGLAAGLAYWNHQELVDDGARAADKLLAIENDT